MQNDTFCCVILITAAVLTGTVQFVLTMIQVRKTAKEVEDLAKKLNEVSPALALIPLAASLFSSLAGKIRRFFAG